MLLVTPIHRPINIIAFLLNWTTMGGVDDWSNFHLQRDTFYARVGVVINEAIADSSTLPLWRRNGQPTATSLLPSPIHGSVKVSALCDSSSSSQGACSPHYLVVLLLSHHPVLAVLGYGPLSDRGCHHSNGNDKYICSVMAGIWKSMIKQSRGHLPFCLWSGYDPGSVDWMKGDTLPPVVYSLRLVIRR